MKAMVVATRGWTIGAWGAVSVLGLASAAGGGVRLTVRGEAAR